METKGSARGSERVAKLSELFLQRLNLYALAAGAAGVSLLALAPPAAAEVVYTPAHIEFKPGSRSFFDLDLNHDGIEDFSFTNYPGGFFYPALSVRLVDNPPLSGGIQGGGLSALALNRGARIGSSKSFSQGDSSFGLRLAFVNQNGDHGDWVNVTNRYLGLKFPINGEVHFGWARLSVGLEGIQIGAVLTGYAFETIPNHPILAGRTSGTADDAPDSEAPTFRRRRSKPVSRVHQTSLGVLALGAPGIPFWRREELRQQSEKPIKIVWFA